MTWLADKLKEEYWKVFEPRYKQKLSNKETEEGATNLVKFFEILT